MDLKKISTDELFRKFAGTRLTGHWDSNNVGIGRKNLKKTAQKRKRLEQELTKRFFGGNPLPTKYDLALELAPDVYALQQEGSVPSLALKVLLATCLSPTNPNATRDDLLKYCVLKTPCVTPNQVHITDLPLEILVLIAAFLPSLADLARASLTCVFLREAFWGSNAVFRGWVQKTRTVGHSFQTKQLEFPGVKKAYPELYFRAFFQATSKLHGKRRIPWKEVAFRWFSWLLLFQAYPSVAIKRTEDLITTPPPKRNLNTGRRSCIKVEWSYLKSSPFFCSSCHRVPPRIYSNSKYMYVRDNTLLGFNCMVICGKCWTSPKFPVVMPWASALQAIDLNKTNALCWLRHLRANPNIYGQKFRYESRPMVAVETVVQAMLTQWGKLNVGHKPNVKEICACSSAITSEFLNPHSPPKEEPQKEDDEYSEQPPAKKKPRRGAYKKKNK